ncbi:MAG: hypothetical protein VYD19_03665 [Myxococcota bacterium]|nr:hypothetical protein [Myxococcota bacterium]
MFRKDSSSLLTISFLVTLPMLACESEDPSETPTAMADQGAGGAGGDRGDGGIGRDGDLGGADDMSECFSSAEDYPSEAWEACVSDEGEYVLAGESTPSSAGRVEAFELILDTLWGAGERPTPDRFIDAELIYGEDEGLGSRVTRRYDAHIEKPAGADCSDAEAGDRWPDYCVGPARIEPMIIEAFRAGIAGETPTVNAATVEAAGIWFLYLSTYKEAYTCAGKAKDCDSSWAYCTGGYQLNEPAIGLMGRLSAVDSEGAARLFDALLALRCWRDLDSEQIATNSPLHQRALDQLDQALDYALSRILITNLDALRAAQVENDEAAISRWETQLQILGPVINRAALEVDPGRAASLLEGWGDLSDGGIEAQKTRLIALFTCP